MQVRSRDGLGGIDIPELVERFPLKFYWFIKHGYAPHVWQLAFHAAINRGNLTRFRHLVAGRRGGKTLSAAWEVLFYCLHPEQFHRDAHGVESSRPLWVWALAKDYKLGRPSLLTFLEVLNQAGLVKDKDYNYNKTEKVIEFPNGSLLEFKSADDPESLRGAGLDILWIDEAAFIPSDAAYNVVRPGLSDKEGLVITTTTPAGKNWFHETFWSDKALAAANQFRVEYTSIDNPYFKREEWEEARATYHPILFKQEYMASFDAFHGVELHGDWLKFYVLGKDTTLGHPDDLRLIPKDGRLDLKTYIGIDPAISTADTADRFAMTLIGVDEKVGQAYIIKQYADRIPFPDQLTKIAEWFHQYRPQMIGIEANAYQKALVQQAARIPGLPPIVPVFAKGKKHERILSMAPLFKIGKVRLHRTMRDFIDEWVSYDSTLKNPKDDVLDSVEIALGVAGVLLPGMTEVPISVNDYEKPAADSHELMQRELSHISSRDNRGYDEDMGDDY